MTLFFPLVSKNHPTLAPPKLSWTFDTCGERWHTRTQALSNLTRYLIDRGICELGSEDLNEYTHTNGLRSQ